MLLRRVGGEVEEALGLAAEGGDVFPLAAAQGSGEEVKPRKVSFEVVRLIQLFQRVRREVSLAPELSESIR